MSCPPSRRLRHPTRGLRLAFGLSVLTLAVGCGTRPGGTGYAPWPVGDGAALTDGSGGAGGPFTFEKDTAGTPGGATPTDASAASGDGGGLPWLPKPGADGGAAEGDGGGKDGGLPVFGVPDGGVQDAGATDTGFTDTGFTDTGATDTGATDTGATDTGAVDVTLPDGGPLDTGKPLGVDKDNDGYVPGNGLYGDCDDNDPTVNPGAKEVCNGKDDDCTGVPDDVDMDGDGFSVCTDDCDDTDININPLAGRDCKNGKDNDCSGVIDALEDGDKDGFAGCKDCDDYDKTVNPDSFELPVDLVDNDCDGQTDEAPVPCDPGTLNTNTMSHYAKAIDICKTMGTTIVSSTFAKQAASNARAIKKTYGTHIKPQEGSHMVVLSSGVAAAKGQPGYKLPQSGTSFTNSAPYPNVKCKNSGTVYDYTEWKLVLKVPASAKSFSFDFNFMSSEYPEWVGSKYNDKFLAILTSKNFKGNVSFDSKGNCISINNAFFTVCNKCSKGDKGLQGTGYEGGIGGGTGWLTTTSPVTGGETITLRFIVFDEGDHILDSAVVIDNFRWDTQAAKGGSPSTIRPGA